jgi:hypothetical protein
MQEEDALNFYERVTQGTKQTNKITLEHSSGSSLPNVRMSPVDKTTLAGIIERLPEEMFDSVEGAESAEEAEEELEESGGSMSAVTGDTVEAFEDLVKKAIDHPNLTKPQMDHIVEELNFETLFELGTEIINISVEETGSVRGFREQA